jgi:hypothetical protein
MGASAKGAPGIEVDDEFTSRRCAGIPTGANREPAADSRGAKELLPHVSPFALVGLAFAHGHRINRHACRPQAGQRGVGSFDHEVSIFGLAQRNHSGAPRRRGEQGARITQFHSSHQRPDLGRENLSGLGLGLELDFDPDAQRITRLLASRRRRFLASRILRLRLTEGFSW